LVDDDNSLDSRIAGISAQARAKAGELDLFDASLWLGKPDHFPLAREIPASTLSAVMGEYGLRGALVSHWDGPRLSPQDGNLALMAADAELPQGVWTVWTGVPLAPGETGALPGVGAPHPRIRGVRLFPRSHRFPLSPWAVGGVCEWCVSHHLPLILWHVEIEWDALYQLASAFPSLPIIVDTQWQKILYHNRALFRLLDARANVLVESSNLIGQDAIGWMVRTWGAERILFGSFLPANDPWSSIGMIQDADISQEEKVLIAGGNARRLVQGFRA
jgi:uncharacterized protein